MCMMFIHRMSQLEKQMDEHDVTHMYQSQKEQEVCYDHVTWRNMYIRICIMWKESDRKLSALSAYMKVHLHGKFGHRTTEPQIHNEA